MSDLIDRLYAHSMDSGDPLLMDDAADEIRRLQQLVESSYHEGYEHGSAAESAHQHGAREDKRNTWERSDAKAALARIDGAAP